MATKSKQPTTRADKASIALDKLTIDAEPGKSPERIGAELGMSPIVGNAVTARIFARGTFGVVDMTESVAVVKRAAAKVQAGDLSDAEAMLMAQAAALNAIFTELARRAALNMGDYLPATETYLRLALKAQAQSRATVETLAEIKNPRPVAFVRQANISNGPQQVNNGLRDTGALPARGGNSANQSNELLEASGGEQLDTGTTRATSSANPQLEAVEALHRSED